MYGDVGITEQQKVCKKSRDDGIKQFSVQHPTCRMFFTLVVTPRAHARSGVKQSVLSVCRLSVCQAKKIEISPHKPSKWGQTIANSKKLLYVYLTEVKALRFAVFRLFPTFITIHNIGSTSS